MNVYDFDKTIYDGDSTVDFCLFCIRRHPALILSFIAVLPAAILFVMKKISKTQFKQRLYRFLRKLNDVDGEVRLFWSSHEKNIKKWYLEQKQNSDLIISASPEFLLSPECERLEITLMASRVDKKTGTYTGVNCSGQEKVRRFYESFPEGKIEEFYSDSYSDTPLAEISQKAFLVRKNERTAWDMKT